MTYLQQEKQEMPANTSKARNNKSPQSPLTHWPTKNSQSSFTIPSLNISFEF